MVPLGPCMKKRDGLTSFALKSVDAGESDDADKLNSE